MPNLEDAYWKLQPVLLEACGVLQREVSDSLGGHTDCTCDFRVIEVRDFVAWAESKAETPFDVWRDSVGLIIGTVTTPTGQQLEEAKRIATKLFTIHEDKESAAICVIPPWAKPAAWNESLALPTHLTVRFVVNPASSENEEAETISLFQPLTLTLSGGGVRAALYQLGILVFLAQQNRLKDVREIVSVSGGSILAAHFLKHWPEAVSQLSDFRSVAAKLLKICRSDIRNRIFIRWIWSRLLPWSWFLRNRGPTGRLRAEYKRIFGATTLGDLSDSCPNLAFVATDSIQHQRVAFTASQILRWSFQGDDHSPPAPILSKGVELSLAVATSSCFPPVFSLLHLTHEDFDITYGEFKEILYLNDGGVVTNLGVEVLIALRKLGWTKGKLILIADAERGLAVKPGNTPMANINATLAALSKAAREAAKLEFGANALPIPFTDRVQKKDGLSIAAETALFNYRTDLDCPTWQEIHGLMIHGAMVARQSTHQHFKPVSADALKQTIATIITEAGGPANLLMPTKAEFRRSGDRQYGQIWFHSIMAILLILGLTAGLSYGVARLVASLSSRESGNDSPRARGVLVQTGEMTGVNGTGEYEVFYPQPYASPPELTWNHEPNGFKITEQRSNGFIIYIHSYMPLSKPPKWTAKGIRKEPSGGDANDDTRDLLFTSRQLSWYDEPVTILDKTLFVSQDFSKLKFGGRNLNLLKIDIRTKNGEAIDWKVTKDPGHNHIIQLEAKSEPYLEFEYRGMLYAIEFIGSAYTTFTLTQIYKPTLQLKAVTIVE
jgi:predicted acylesterase/phospholipase RssA